MDSLMAVCPECKKQITVNPTDVVEVCKWCNRPFRTSDAILLYRYQMTKQEATRQPADEAIDKFYLIVDKDYKLARDYLVSFVAKEYPKLYNEKLLYYSISYIGEKDRGTGTERVLLETLKSLRENIEAVKAINPSIAGMYYKLLCASVNRMLLEKGKIGQKRSFSGGLPYIKLHVGDLGSRLKKTNSIRSIFERNKFLQGKDFDDEYVLYVIERIALHYAFEKPQEELIGRLAEFLSPAGKKELPLLRKKIEADTEILLKEARQKVASRMLPFWQIYINLLKSGKVAEAQRHLNRGNRYAYTEAVKKENAKFKKGLFKLKYKGNISALDPDKLAEMDVKNLKYNDIPRFKRGNY